MSINKITSTLVISIMFLAPGLVSANSPTYEDASVCTSLFLTASMIEEDKGSADSAKLYLDIGTALLQGSYNLGAASGKTEVQIDDKIKEDMLTLYQIHSENAAEFNKLFAEYGDGCLDVAKQLVQ